MLFPGFFNFTVGILEHFKGLKMNSVELGVSERSQKHLRGLKSTSLLSWSFLIFSKISKSQTIPLGPRFKEPLNAPVISEICLGQL